jgi:hypothetical protein
MLAGRGRADSRTRRNFPSRWRDLPIEKVHRPSGGRPEEMEDFGVGEAGDR